MSFRKRFWRITGLSAPRLLSLANPRRKGPVSILPLGRAIRISYSPSHPNGGQATTAHRRRRQRHWAFPSFFPSVYLSSSYPTWIPKLPDLFREAGLELVQEDVKGAPGYLARAMHECGLIIPQMLASQAGNNALQENIRRLMPMVEQETKQGALLAFTRWTVIGRKPLQIPR